MNQETNKQDGANWDAYWQGIGSARAFDVGGVTHPGFAAFWSGVLGDYFAMHPGARVLDIGSGSGAVVEHLAAQPGVELEKVTCLDISTAAIDAAQARFPGVQGIVADARSVPADADRFDLITSQFGLEYASDEALDEAVRLLAPGGRLIALMHIRSGALDRECMAAVDALRRTRECGFLQRAHDFLEAGFAAIKSDDRTRYDALAREMNPAISEVEAILTQHGEHVAGDTIVQLYDSVQNFHSRIQHYAPDDVLGWLNNMQEELLAHEKRMISMHDAALDEDAFQAVCNRLTDLDVSAGKGEPLTFDGGQLPYAWVIEAADGISPGNTQ